MSKRKNIVIYQENNAPIYLEDEDDRNLEEYSKELSSFLTLTNISILQTSTAALITRPSKICSMTVHEEQDYESLDAPEPAEEVNKEEVEENQEEVDIITDVDS